MENLSTTQNYSIRSFSSDQIITFIDLFAGMGGMRIGFENAVRELGLLSECVFSSEIKTHAKTVYQSNFGNDPIHGDITQIDEKSIPDFDFLLAGFPCQAFSNAGKRLGFEDTRGTLFFDVARILKEKMPKGFLLENVEGLVTHNNGKTLQTILNVLDDLGYTVSHGVLDGQDFGLAQSRKRIYICGSLHGSPVDFNSFDKTTSVLADVIEQTVPPVDTAFTQRLFEHFSLEEVIGKQIKDKRGGDSNIHSWSFSLKGHVSDEQKQLLDVLLRQRRNKKWADIIGIDWMDGMPLTVPMIREFHDVPNLQAMLDDLVEKKYLAYEHPKAKVDGKRVYDTSLERGYNIVTGKLSFEFNKILDPQGITPTIVATDASKLAVPVRHGIRPLTTREGMRLFGFPETFDMSAVPTTKAFDLLGNTVCVNAICQISQSLIQSATQNKGATDHGTHILRRTV